MKFDDVKKVEEGVMSNLFGRGAAAGVKSAVGKQSGQTQEHILAQDIFLQDFTSDALGAIQTAVDAGLIVKDGEVVDPTEVPAPAPAQAPAPAAPAKAKAARPQGDGGKAAQAAVQATNNYIKGISQQMSKIQDPKQKMELSKELVNYMKDRQGRAEWENGVKTAEMVLKKNLDPKFAMGLIGQLKRPLKQPQQLQRQNPSAAPKGNVQEAYGIYMLNQLAEACGFTLKQLGYTVLTEGRPNKYRLVQNNYLKLNNIFESMLGEAAGTKTMKQFLNDWLANYMQGVPEAEYGPALKGIVDEFSNAWNTTGKLDQTILNKLGKGSYAATKTAGVTPEGAKDAQGAGQAQPAAAGGQAAPVQNAQQQAQQQAQPAQAQAQQAQAPAQAQAQAQPAQAGGAQNGYQQAQAIKSSLNKLYNVDQVVYNDLVKSLQQKPVKTDEPPAVAMTGNEKPNQVGGPTFTDPSSQQVAPAKAPMKGVGRGNNPNSAATQYKKAGTPGADQAAVSNNQFTPVKAVTESAKRAERIAKLSLR